MDHLSKPENPFKPLAIPFLGAPHYDGGDFAGYPERMGFNIEIMPLGLVRDKSLDDVAAFLQMWLYFGTLKEVLGICEISFEIKDFVCPEKKELER